MSGKKRTHCFRGHELTPENTKANGNARQCRICINERARLGSLPPILTEDLFWGKVDKALGLGPNGECWEWRGALDPGGYGRAAINNRTVSAHRTSYVITKGAIPKGLVVRHTCDNPKCVNPLHLELGTIIQNAADMVARGRSAGQKKTHCPQGHEYSEKNTHVTKKGYRCCRTCGLARDATRDKATRAAATRRWRQQLLQDTGTRGRL
jgi:hypothetical protein